MGAMSPDASSPKLWGLCMFKISQPTKPGLNFYSGANSSNQYGEAYRADTETPDTIETIGLIERVVDSATFPFLRSLPTGRESGVIAIWTHSSSSRHTYLTVSRAKVPENQFY